jgi:polygalacturonase
VHVRRSRDFALVLTLAVSGFSASRAQDTRIVTEPVIPASCTVLTAQLSSGHGSFSDTDEAKLDTVRIQSAMDTCAKSHAVELKADGAKNAFFTGPLSLRAGVILLVDKGVTLYGSRNPKDYELEPGSCLVVRHANERGCRSLFTADGINDSGIMGDGIIDGRGGTKMMGGSMSWWDVARQAHIARKNHQITGALHTDNRPDLTDIENAKNFTLYRITFRNSPHFNIVAHHTDGMTVWGVKVDAPADAPNTGGFNLSASTNVTMTHSYIREGDDNMAIKASSGPSTNISVIDNHFYWGNGMSIGSNTYRGLNHVLIRDLSLDGTTNGVRIKSDVAGGGLVEDVKYDDICIRGSKNPIAMTTNWGRGGRSGNRLPVYQDITLHNVRLSGGGKIPIEGIDATHRIGIQFDGVIALDNPALYKVSLAYADLTLGPGPVNLAFPAGKDSTVQGKSGPGTLDGCQDMFVPVPVAP